MAKIIIYFLKLELNARHRLAQYEALQTESTWGNFYAAESVEKEL